MHHHWRFINDESSTTVLPWLPSTDTGQLLSAQVDTNETILKFVVKSWIYRQQPESLASTFARFSFLLDSTANWNWGQSSIFKNDYYTVQYIVLQPHSKKLAGLTLCFDICFCHVVTSRMFGFFYHKLSFCEELKLSSFEIQAKEGMQKHAAYAVGSRIGSIAALSVAELQQNAKSQRNVSGHSS